METERIKEGDVNLALLIKSFFATTLSFAVWMIGGFDLSVKILLGLMFLDYVSGIRVGYIKKNLNSKRAYEGLSKKFMVLVLVCGASLMNRIIPNSGIRVLVTIFYSATELLSVIENVAKCGIIVPEKLKKVLEQLRED